MKDALMRGKDPRREAHTVCHVTHKLWWAEHEIMPPNINTISPVFLQVIQISGTQKDTNKSIHKCLTFLFYKPLQFSDYESVMG